MAQTKKKRRRKHRGTQAGNIERPGRTGRPSGSRPATKADARATAAERRQARFDKEPTWRGSLNRSAFAAVKIGILGGKQQSTGQAAAFAAMAAVLYTPVMFATDKFIYTRKQKQITGAAAKKA